ncbi:hypothetical protein K0M31_000572 [Melipona bicolor]|uniref:Uncharacterized protein n=1 Tax=Melipona bicolor TaxID=60889 RepID=A0AA40GDS9_9HYME|nr:hypothetical protein K0M31_000572 [Melipona bicolor]
MGVPKQRNRDAEGERTGEIGAKSGILKHPIPSTPVTRARHSSCSIRDEECRKARNEDGTALSLWVLHLGHVFSTGQPTTETRKSPVGTDRPTKLRSYRISLLDQQPEPALCFTHIRV